jgi:hypothetical protein
MTISFVLELRILQDVLIVDLFMWKRSRERSVMPLEMEKTEKVGLAGRTPTRVESIMDNVNGEFVEPEFRSYETIWI